MAPMLRVAIYAGIGLALPFSAVADSSEEEIEEIIVRISRVANTRPAGTYAAPATILRFDPSTELQSRGLAEGQADVTVRGGLFENTGFKAGAVSIMDPQTGHYVAELPIDPDLLSSPEVLTGIDNALSGFNSSIATVAYAWRRIVDGGSILAGAGSDNLQFQSLRVSKVATNDSSSDFAATLSFARSQGDGSVLNGDHEFERYNLHMQHSNVGQQSDLLLSYQDKFYGWPGAYTGFASLPETDHTITTLLLANHRRESGNGWWELGAFYRRLEDDYDFDRTTQESGTPGSFDHETKVYGVGFQGLHSGSTLNWNYAGQVTADELVFSTDLTEGRFDSRSYASLSLVPSIEIARTDDRELTVRFGATVDWSSRDDSAASPVLGATLRKTLTTGSRYLAVEYAGTSQLPGYTALNSRPAGLFGGNADLGREEAKQVSVTLGKETPDWSGSVTLFFRRDEKLVDWTFKSGAPFARQANPVDMDVFGIEAIFQRQWDALALVVAYVYLEKDADYGSATVDASFYAMNFARHRITVAASYQLTDQVSLRLDNEYRQQESNPLRGSSSEAYLLSASLAWEPVNGRGFGFAITADNLTDDSYEQFPGTPAAGRQISASARYLW